MRTSPARRALAVAALAWALAPAALTAAPASPTPPDKSKAGGPAAALRKALDAPITLKIDKQPLAAAIDMLKEKGKVNLVLDSFTIQQTYGWTPEQPPTPVDIDVKDVKLKSALRTVLAPYNLSYAVVGDEVVVTTEDAAVARQMRQRVDVDVDKEEFAEALRQLGRETGANLILDSRVEKEAKNPVSLQMEDVPLETAVRLLSEMAGLKPVRVGNVLFVTDKKTAAELRNDPDLSQPTQPGGNPALLREQALLQMQQAQLGNWAVAAPIAGTGPGGAVAPPAVAADPITIKQTPDEKPAESTPDKKDGKDGDK
jgi:hypothetical protein